MPVLLTYAINTIPNPLTAKTPGGILTLIATNGTGAPVTIIGINIGIPVGTETDGLALTSLPSQIVPIPPRAWTMGNPTQSSGLYTFLFTPPNNSDTLPAGGSLVFELTNIVVNDTPGTDVKIIITEGSDGLPTYSYPPLSKFPAGWGAVNFSAIPPNLINEGDVTLHWDGPAGAVYTIQYYDPATQQIITIPAGDPPLGNSGTIPGLNISATTVFTLIVQSKIPGQPYSTEAPRIVTVGRIPAITAFTGTMTGPGDSLQLNLTWKATNADHVLGSWTSALQAPNPGTPAVIYAPFNQFYSVSAINSAQPSEPKYLHLSWIAYPHAINMVANANPFGIAITADNQFAFVGNSGNNTVSVIDIKTLAVRQTIPVGGNPMGIAITPDHRLAFVACNADNLVVVIDIDTLKTAPPAVFVGLFPNAIDITPDGNYAFVTNAGDATISVIDIQTLAVAHTITLRAHPQPIAITPDGKSAFVSDVHKGISIINIETRTVSQTTSIVANPFAIAFTPDGKFAFVTNYYSNTVSVLNVSTLAVTQTITVGNNPAAIAFTPDGKYAFVANSKDNTVSVINVSALAVTQTIAVGINPRGIAITPDGRYIFVSNFSGNTVSVLGWGLPA